MEGNYSSQALYTESVQPLFDQLEKKLVFIPDEATRKTLIDVFVQLICM